MLRIYEAIEKGYKIFATHSIHGRIEAKIKYIHYEYMHIKLKAVEDKFCLIDFEEIPLDCDSYDSFGWSVGPRFRVVRTNEFYLNFDNIHFLEIEK